ncbi:MAG: 3-dehydroquinate dehydratase [Bacteroidetes bacterium]|nr:3-dehydroquinate dehydratase [Bacteroidota bacterium]
MKILIINGPNLNLLGQREPEIYGDMSFEEYLDKLKKDFPSEEINYFQSNDEGELIERLQAAGKEADAVVLNPGGYTHTSVSLADAVAAIKVPVIEVHISDPRKREDYRHVSLFEDKCTGTISGLGLRSYELAIEHLIDLN